MPAQRDCKRSLEFLRKIQLNISGQFLNSHPVKHMTNMKKALILTVFLAAVTAQVLQARGQRFTISGKIDGIVKGDTLRFGRITLPGWEIEHAFDIVVEKDGEFKCKGTQEHDQFYLMEYFPADGAAPVCDRMGKNMVISGGDHITMDGTRDEVYYCTLGGGIYKDPALSAYLRASDSLDTARGSYARKIEEANAAGDHETAAMYGEKFNTFYNGNPGVERVRKLRKEYFDSNTGGNIFTLVEYISSMDYTPIETLKKQFDGFSRETRDSWYGKVYQKRMNSVEAISIGNQAPDFTLTMTDGSTVSKDGFSGKYLLIYHWGMCPGSLSIDRYVQDLFSKYRDRGLEVIGITESMQEIRDIWEKTKEGSSIPSLGIDDFKATLNGMLNHPWPDAELDTGHPENRKVSDMFLISGWPFFIFIGPDGKILARDFSEAFDQAKKILEEKFGE